MMDASLNSLKPILGIGNTESDTEDVKRQHGFLIYMGLLMSIGGIIWGVLCLFNDLYLAAIVPFTYVFITFFNFLYLYKSKNFTFSMNLQIFISLILPFVFQFFLGGFIASGGNVLWSVIAVFGSFTQRNKRASLIWLLQFIIIMILSGIIDPYAKQYDMELAESYNIAFFVLNFILTISIIFSLFYYFVNSEENARNNLQDSLELLEIAQEQLIDSEKMASLGTLVSGISHEINTPLGVGLTGISQIDHEVREIESNYASENLTEEALLGSISTIKQLTQTIRDRLSNAVSLVKSFKSISVDQHFEDRREFMLRKYIDDLILSLKAPLKSKNVTIINDIDAELEFDSYPGIYSQIISNLILNSIKHGFEEGEENVIKISLTRELTRIILHYEDNGCGVSDEVEKRMFDPFFTTKRGQGGSGLGMNIVYNLVTQKLDSHIKMVKIFPHGLRFDISLNSLHIRK
ncbi:sensor histidine kinase [Sulfurimonas sp.]|uniref:sensor histidine kinase n=1 Tax=Sulfurimonas sp. TaxID=2022749 RepID=UPI0039E424AD